MNRRIPKRSRHKLSPQLDILCKLVAPALVEWSPAANPETSLGAWHGPLPHPLGSVLSAVQLGSVVAGDRHAQWFVGVTPARNGTRLVCEFLLRVGAPHCPNPRWWRLVTGVPLCPEVQLFWAAEVAAKRGPS
jgi:hypothetical protein